MSPTRLALILAATAGLVASMLTLGVAAEPADAQTRCSRAYIGGCVPPGDVNCPDLTRNGETFSVWVRQLGVDPAGLDRDNDRDACEANGDLPPRPRERPIGRLFGIQANAKGVVTARGWAFDPDLVRRVAIAKAAEADRELAPRAHVSPSKVQLRVNGKRVQVRLAKNPEAKVPARYAEFWGRSGFLVRTKLAKGTHNVCVVAVNGGARQKNRGLGCKRIVVR